MYNNKTYGVINIFDIGLIDFSQIAQSSASTVRRSLDETKFIIKWSTEPDFIVNGTITPLETHTHETVLTLMSTSQWSEDLIEI